MKIGIVDDQILALEALRRVISSDPEYRISWIAKNGSEAVEKCESEIPDLILMDLVMPVMDGVEATKIITERFNCPILVVTSTIKDNSSRVFEAMSYGALDVVCTPNLGLKGSIEGGNELLEKISQIRKRLVKPQTKNGIRITELRTKIKPFPLIVIGSSTGGPKALAKLVGELPANLDSSIVIVQHVDSKFAVELASWLNNHSPMMVKLIKEGSRVKMNVIYLAASNDHLVIGTDHCFHYIKEPEHYPFRPSIDVFYRSLKNNWQKKGVAVILTGMGSDGAKGLLLLKESGWHTIAQDEKSSVIFGMPKAAIQMNAAIDILPIDLIASMAVKRLTQLIKDSKGE